jgi:hypothetical protein
MSDINTTSIHDLPSDPMAGSSKGSSNMSMSINETNNGNSSNSNSRSLSLDQTTISQIVNGLQQASIAGATMLPSRDIPQTTHAITSDPQIQANYVPPAESNDYIGDDDYDNDETIHNYNRTTDVKNSLESIYDEIQTPLLLAILYFLFQLPIIRKTLCKYIPLLCNNDGNYNINGLVFTSALFALIFFVASSTFSKGGAKF